MSSFDVEHNKDIKFNSLSKILGIFSKITMNKEGMKQNKTKNNFSTTNERKQQIIIIIWRNLKLTYAHFGWNYDNKQNIK